MFKINYNYTKNIYICNIDKYSAQYIIQLMLDKKKSY